MIKYFVHASLMKIIERGRNSIHTKYELARNSQFVIKSCDTVKSSDKITREHKIQ